MEDAHIAELDLGDSTSVFGVFDGHGGIIFINSISPHIDYFISTKGAEVALFVKDHFINELRANQNFKQRVKLDEALRETFIQMDKLMIKKEGIRKLFSYKDQ